MAQFYENFNGATVGAGHPDFSVLWGSLGISVVSGSILTGDSNAHLLLSHVTGTYARNAASWDVGQTSGATVVRALVEFQNQNATTPGSISGAFLSGTGTSSTRSGYVQWLRRSYAISRYENGDDAVAATDTEYFSAAAGGLIVQRYVEILRDGALVEVREWDYDGGVRPELPSLTFTDASPLPVAGAFGLSHLSTATASFPDMRVYEIAVGTDGSTVPTQSLDPNAIDIANINTNNELAPGTTATITGTNLGNTTAITVGGVSQTDVTAVNSTTVTFTVVRGGNPYNQDLTAQLTSSDGTSSIVVQQVAESGTFTVTASGPNTTDPESLWSGLVDTSTGDPITIVSGDQAWVKNPNNLSNLAITPAGEISADTEGTFVVQVWLASEGVWGDDQTVTFTAEEITQVPQGTVTIGTITVGETTASIPFTYNDTDQTGFEYSLDGGAWTATTSPVSLSGLPDSTLHSISIRAVNGIGSGTAATKSFTTNAASATVPQLAPVIGTITKDTNSASIPFTYPGSDATSFQASTNGVDWVTVTSPISRTGLSASTAYSGQVRAVNAEGTGPEASYGFTTDAPQAQVPQSKPVIGIITKETTSASIPFSYPGSDATSFEHSTNGSTWEVVTSPISRTALSPETVYNGQIRAVNAEGPGDPVFYGFITKAEVIPGEDNWRFSKRVSHAAPKTWTWGNRHPKTGMRVRIFK